MYDFLFSSVDNSYGIIMIIFSIIIDILVFITINKKHLKSKFCIITEIILIICSVFFIKKGIKLMNQYVYADVGYIDFYIDPYPYRDEGYHNLEIAGIINIGKLLFIVICAFIKKKINNKANEDGTKWHGFNKN